MTVYVYRKCRCGPVLPFSAHDPMPSCRECNSEYDIEPDYDDYVKVQKSRARIAVLIRATGDEALIKQMYDVW